MQTLCYFIQGTWASLDFGSWSWNQTSPQPLPWILRDDRSEKKGEASGMFWLEVVGMRKLQVGRLAVRILCDWFGEHIWLSLVDPELKRWAQNRKAGSQWPNPDCSGFITAEVVAWLPGLLSAGCGWEFYCHIWSGHCLFVYSVSQ